MKLDAEPRLSNGPGLFASLLDWARKVVQAGNESTDKIASNTAAIATKVNRSGDTMTGGLNLVTPSTSATEAASDNSTRIATTAWAKVGLVVSLGAVGYVKFPTWLGGWIIQWGSSTPTVTGGGATISYPLTFPAANYTTIVANGDWQAGAAPYWVIANGPTLSNLPIVVYGNAGGGVFGTPPTMAIRVNWLAIGN